MCGLWLMGEGLTHRAGGEGGGEDGVKGHEQTGGAGKKEAEKQGCVHRAWVLGNSEPSSGVR